LEFLITLFLVVQTLRAEKFSQQPMPDR